MVFKKIIFQNRYVALETPSRPPPPLHGKCHLKFPFWFFDSVPKKINMISKTAKNVTYFRFVHFVTWTFIGKLRASICLRFFLPFLLLLRFLARFSTCHLLQLVPTGLWRNLVSANFDKCFPPKMSVVVCHVKYLAELSVSAFSWVCFFSDVTQA